MTIPQTNIKKILSVITFVLIAANFQFIAAQPPLPNRTVAIRATQALNFSSFCTGNTGGTVVISADGSRTSSGSVVLVSSGNPPTPAIFEISLCQGRSIILSYPPTIILTGSNGGTLSLQLTPEKGAGGTPFQVNNDCNFITPLRVGGTLTVGTPASAPAGLYTGSFEITFNQE